MGWDENLGKLSITLLKKYFFMLFKGNFICVELIDNTCTGISFQCEWCMTLGINHTLCFLMQRCCLLLTCTQISCSVLLSFFRYYIFKFKSNKSGTMQYFAFIFMLKILLSVWNIFQRKKNYHFICKQE